MPALRWYRRAHRAGRPLDLLLSEVPALTLRRVDRDSVAGIHKTEAGSCKLNEAKSSLAFPSACRIAEFWFFQPFIDISRKARNPRLPIS